MFTIFFYILNRIFPYRLYTKLKHRKASFYSWWIKNEFLKVGDRVHVGYLSRLHGAKYISIGDRTSVGKNAVLEAYDTYKGQTFSPSITIGSDCSINDECHVTCINKIMLGNGVLMGRRVLISDNSHGASSPEMLDILPHYRPLVSKGPVIIEDNVWIGEMACILPGVTVGKGSIIGANCVVTKDVPPYSVVCGNPGRVVKCMRS